MAYRYDDKFVKCPFYIAETSNAIKCESVICYQQSNIFRSASEKRKYKKRYCTYRYCDCKNHKEVSKKYEQCEQMDRRK